MSSSPEDRPGPSPLTFVALCGLAGAVIGLIAGLIVMAVVDGGAFENPFWLVAAGIILGAVVAPVFSRGR